MARQKRDRLRVAKGEVGYVIGWVLADGSGDGATLDASMRTEDLSSRDPIEREHAVACMAALRTGPDYLTNAGYEWRNKDRAREALADVREAVERHREYEASRKRGEV